MTDRGIVFSQSVGLVFFAILLVSFLNFLPAASASGIIFSGSPIPISSIQFTADPAGDSPYESQIVSTRGIVYAVYPSGFAISDAPGAWNGIYVYTLNAPTVAIGDLVEVAGVVDEYFGRTTIGKISNLPAVTPISNGNAIHAATPVTVNQIETFSVSAESLEGVFVTTGPITVTNTNPDAPTQFYEWEISDPLGSARVNDLAQSVTYVPALSETLEFVQGMLNFTFGNTKIEPRDDDDIGFLAGGGLGDCDDPATGIHTVQGTGTTSPLVGEQVIIEGQVIGDYGDTDQLGGYFLQQAFTREDNNPATSEGLFVEANANIDISKPSFIRIRGIVTEVSGMTTLTNLDRYERCDYTFPVRVPLLELPTMSTDQLEATEGMLVSIKQKLFVTDNNDLGRLGTLTLSAIDRLYQPTQVSLPGAAALVIEDANNRSRIILDDGSVTVNPATVPYDPLRAGNSTDEVEGLLDYRFGDYRIHPSATVTFNPDNLGPLMPPQVGGRIQIASFNVMDYFTTIDTGAAICGPAADAACPGADSVSEFNRQRDKIIHAIATLDADIIGLTGIENHTTDVALKDIVAGLNTRTIAGTWDYIETGAIGSDVTKVAIIYQPEKVTPNGVTAVLDNSAESTFDDTHNHPAIAQSFIENATDYSFTIVVNHFKSKDASGLTNMADPDYDQADGQGFWNATRTAAAEAELKWLAGNPTGTGSPDILILGNLNAWAMENPLTIFENAGFINQVKRFRGTGEYNYNVEGQFGTLDYALASFSLAHQLSGAAIWHSNADAPRIFDYNEEFNPPSLYRPDEFRSSDHDAIIIGYNPEPIRIFLPIIIQSSGYTELPAK